MKKVRVKMEVRQYVEEVYWIDEVIEIPDGEDIEEYLKEGLPIDEDTLDLSNSQITVRDEEKTIELIEEINECKKCKNKSFCDCDEDN